MTDIQWAAKEFGLKENQVLWYHSGICYSRIGVKSKAAANKVTHAVKGNTVNGGMLDGMPLGGQIKKKDGTYEVYC